MNHKEYIANFREIPREFVFIERIPKNTMGKNSESLIDPDFSTSETYYVDVKENNMKANTFLFGGIVYSQRVMLELIEKGLTREDAYVIVQRNALDAFENNGDFRYNLEHDDDILEFLSTDELDDCFQMNDYLKNVDKIFEKFEM